jgi:hypothetical protein
MRLSWNIIIVFVVCVSVKRCISFQVNNVNQGIWEKLAEDKKEVTEEWRKLLNGEIIVLFRYHCKGDKIKES